MSRVPPPSSSPPPSPSPARASRAARWRAPAARLGLSALAAVLLFLSAPTFDLWPLMWIGLVPQLHVALSSATPRRAFWQGWLTGIIANTVAFGWMRGLLERFGHMPAIEAIPIMLLLTTYQGLEFGLLSWGIYRVRRRTGLPLALVAPLVMVAIELCVPQIFPFYLAISQAWVIPVIQIADLTGPLGVTFVLVACNGAIYDALAAWRAGGEQRQRRALRPLAAVALLVALVVAYGFARIHQIDARRAAAPKATAGLVQANVGILEKWDPREFARLLDTHQRLSADLERAGADFIVWPESSYPYTLSRDLERDFPAGDPRRVMRGFDRPLLFGAVTRAPGPPRRSADRYPYNTALSLDAGGRITGKFDKVFLMVFGEYIPFYDSIPWFTQIFPEASNFSRGSDPASFPLDVKGRRFLVGPLICYEDILPGFTRRVAALRPNLLVNMTNDAWFGRTSEPYQHLALAVFRSVEHRLEMVRAVNTGVSAHIDATGRVRAATASVDPAALPAAPPTTLLSEVALLDGGGLYAKVGDLFGFLCLAALIALLARGGHTGRAGGRPSKRRAGRRPKSA
jgi:apolipoprotein N-acyltransferase